MRNLKIAASLVCLLGAGVLTAVASDADAKWSDVDTAALKKMIDDKSAVVVDVRDAEAFGKSHIPSAKNITTAKLSAETLGENKDQPLVFYCQNTSCKACHKAADKAVELGYTHVHIYSQGIEGWESAGEKADSGT